MQKDGMPLQNRVTPFGEIVASEARGTLMGNRGCLHDDTAPAPNAVGKPSAASSTAGHDFTHPQGWLVSE